MGRRNDALRMLDGLARRFKESGNGEALTHVRALCVKLDPDNPRTLLAHADALEAASMLAEAYLQRTRAAELLIHAGDPGTAEEHLRRVLKQDPHRTHALKALAKSLNAQGRTAEARETLRRMAADLREREEFDESRNALEALLAEEPNDLPALEQLVAVAEKLGDQQGVLSTRFRLLKLHQSKRRYKEASAEAEAILALAPESLDARRALLELSRVRGDKTEVERRSLELADLHREAGDPRSERETLESLLHDHPGNFDARERLLMLLADMHGGEDLYRAVDELIQYCSREEQEERGVVVLRKLVLKAPSDPTLREKLIDLLEEAGRIGEQAEQIRELIALRESRGDGEEVIGLLRMLVLLRPTDTRTRWRLAELLANASRPEDAIEQLLVVAAQHIANSNREEGERAFREVLHHDPESEAALRGLADLALDRGDNKEAVNNLRELGYTQARARHYDHALEVLGEAVRLEPHDTGLRRQVIELCANEEFLNLGHALAELDALARIYEARGEEQPALAARREAIALVPSDVRLRRNLINHLMEIGRTAIAVEELAGLAEMQRGLGHHAEALAAIEEALQHDPDNVRVRTVRAEIYEERGEEKKALAEWRALAPLLREASRGGSTRDDEDTGPGPSPIVREYDFESYVVGDRNRFAWATSMAVAKAPGKTPHNPLFLYSDVGLGKTHILHAIGNYILRHIPDGKVLYTSAEDFTSELIDAIQNNTVMRFRQKHKNVDVLLLDDAHLLAGKERAQEEFFHIFNTLFQAKKQIVVTSDRPPKDIAHLEKRLKSRFGAGVIVDMQPPDVETRIAILRGAAKARGIDVGDDALLILAERVESNIRELKGAFNQLILLHEVGGEPLNADTARKAVGHFIATRE